MFIKRIFQYSLKHLSNGAARVYIQNSSNLRASNFCASDPIDTKIEPLKVTITKSVGKGDMIVKSTARGELVEVRNKKLGTAFQGVNQVTITFRKGVITIEVSKRDRERLIREQTLIHKLVNNIPLSMGSLYSGVGLLSLALKEGIERCRINTEHAFSNDIDELALTIQLESNPIWENHSKDALAVVDDISNLDYESLPKQDVVEIGYPCWGMSKLCKKHLRDLKHPIAGAKFIPTVNYLRHTNPSMIILECSVPFLTSDTYDLLKRELPGYRFNEGKISGYDHGDFEERERCVVVALSVGLADICLETFTPPAVVERRAFKSVMDEVCEQSSVWKKYEHVTKKIDDKRLNFRHKLYTGTEDKIAAIPATYHSPKIGSPMIKHPSSDRQRLISWSEHGKVRDIPELMHQAFKRVATGKHPLVSKRGNIGVIHKMLGNSVSPKAWRNFGEFVGQYFSYLREYHLA